MGPGHQPTENEVHNYSHERSDMFASFSSNQNKRRICNNLNQKSNQAAYGQCNENEVEATGITAAAVGIKYNQRSRIGQGSHPMKNQLCADDVLEKSDMFASLYSNNRSEVETANVFTTLTATHEDELLETETPNVVTAAADIENSLDIQNGKYNKGQQPTKSKNELEKSNMFASLISYNRSEVETPNISTTLTETPNVTAGVFIDSQNGLIQAELDENILNVADPDIKDYQYGLEESDMFASFKYETRNITAAQNENSLDFRNGKNNRGQLPTKSEGHSLEKSNMFASLISDNRSEVETANATLTGTHDVELETETPIVANIDGRIQDIQKHKVNQDGQDAAELVSENRFVTSAKNSINSHESRVQNNVPTRKHPKRKSPSEHQRVRRSKSVGRGRLPVKKRKKMGDAFKVRDCIPCSCVHFEKDRVTDC